MDLKEELKKEIIRASLELDDDILKALKRAKDKEDKIPDKRSKASSLILQAILDNLYIAKEKKIPMCQDTGMGIFFVKLSSRCKYNISDLDRLIKESAKEAFLEGGFRKSIVEDPLFNRKNTDTNMPIIIEYEVDESINLRIDFMLKGFGSENCSNIVMLNPTSSKEDIIAHVLRIVKESNAKSCPPVIVGIGLGGSLEKAVSLSKQSLFRDLDKGNEIKEYKELEMQILDKINTLNIGTGGMGGSITALAVSILTYPTHIAGMPLAVSVSCWADRKGRYEEF